MDKCTKRIGFKLSEKVYNYWQECAREKGIKVKEWLIMKTIPKDVSPQVKQGFKEKELKEAQEENKPEWQKDTEYYPIFKNEMHNGVLKNAWCEKYPHDPVVQEYFYNRKKEWQKANAPDFQQKQEEKLREDKKTEDLVLQVEQDAIKQITKNKKGTSNGKINTKKRK